ncbi:energy transducer TonB [candidate division WOR-3 bacterium]|nr:energy transducer TonB [candidate division WOR-3 bacterium]
MYEGFDLKKLYPLHMRIALLVTLVVFILAFMFIPEGEMQEYKPKVITRIEVHKLPPQLQNIVKPPPPPKPKMPVAAESDEEAEAETIEKTDFEGYEKEADIELNVPDFVPYDTPPMPINLDEIRRRTPYPESAKRLGIEGTVWLKLLLDTEGKVRKVVLVKSLYPALDKVAMTMVKQVKFTPAMQRDLPVAVWLSFPYKFSLED